MRSLQEKYMNKLVIVLVMGIFLTACKPETQPTTTLLPTPVLQESTQTAIVPTTVSTITSTQEPIPTAVLPLEGKQTKYLLNLTLDFYNQNASVYEEVIYTNKTSVELADILLIISPRYFQGSFNLTRLQDVYDQVISNYIWEGTNLRIPLAPALKPGEQLILKMQYTLKLPVREGTFGVAGRQINLANWYPYIPPYEETRGWVVEDMHVVNSQIVGEYLVYEPSDFEVNLKFTDRKENMEVAASSAAEISNGVWHYELPLARTFVLSISDVYLITEIKQDGILIQVYSFIGNNANAGAAADIAANAFALFNEIYSPYRRKQFTIVEAEFEHNMEYDGLVFINKGVIQFHNGTAETNLTMLVPHEISHQWFFSLVGNNQAQEPWLDEAFATYSEALYYQKYHPDKLQWWWDNRIDFYKPSGFVNSTIYFPNGYYDYTYAIYLQGARFMQELRDTIGDDAYFAFLKDYVASYSYKSATAQDFFDTLARHNQADITPVLDKYFKSP